MRSLNRILTCKTPLAIAADRPVLLGFLAEGTQYDNAYRICPAGPAAERLANPERFLQDEQVRLRGPFLSLSEFVNRRLSNDTDLALAGAIQGALNQLAADHSLNPFQIIQDESVPSVANPPGPHGYVFPEAAVGHNTYGLPGWTRQADILRPLAPILSARDDTFTIRAYGESRDAAGKVLARAWCEATVQRTRDFLDSTDEPDITTPPSVSANRTCDRRFKVVSFRWLNANEV